MSSHPEGFEDFLFFSLDPSLNDSNLISSWGRNDMSFYDEPVEEQYDGLPFQQSLDNVRESEGLFADPLMALNHYHSDNLSSTPFDTITNDQMYLISQSNYLQLPENENPFQTRFHDTLENPFQTAHQNPAFQPLADPLLSSTAMQNSSARGLLQQTAYQTHRQTAQHAPLVNFHKLSTIQNSQPFDYSTEHADNSLHKRETSATLSRNLSEITAEEQQTVRPSTLKRKRSLEDETDELEEAIRPKTKRKTQNKNVIYRLTLKESRPEPKFPEEVKNLFKHLKTAIIPKKNYYRKKGSHAAASHPSIPSEGSTVISRTGETAAPSTSNKPSRQSNPRRPIPVEIVRQIAVPGYDPYNNDYYSGDDNVSDNEMETKGKATDYKPPRMACRRCNKLKAPCDHAYPSCSLCAKFGLRCRYRDDLTGRQIRPGQLEEVESALIEARKVIRLLQEKLEKVDNARNSCDEDSKDNPKTQEKASTHRREDAD